jgi:hypothetical protein
VKLVNFSSTIGKADRREVGMLERVEPIQSCNLLVKTPPAKFSITLLGGPETNRVVGWHDPAATAATDAAIMRYFALLHML